VVKYRFEPVGTPRDMSDIFFQTLLPKHNWTPDVKKTNHSILVGVDEPHVKLLHFVVAVVHAIKIFGQYGKLMERLKISCAVINYAMDANRVVVHHPKVTGQRLKKITRESLQEWIEGLCDSFAGDDSQRCYQGDGDATLDVAVGLIDGIPQQATTDGVGKTADELYRWHLENVKAQKDSGLYKVSEVEKQKELQRSTLMNQINREVTGKLLVFLLFFFIFYSNIKFGFTVFYVILSKFTCH
jgi:hypothetical protein